MRKTTELIGTFCCVRPVGSSQTGSKSTNIQAGLSRTFFKMNALYSKCSFGLVLCSLLVLVHPLWAQRLDEVEPLPGVLYVQFTGLPAFGNTGLSIDEVSSAFPILEHMAAKRALPPEALLLQSIYRITYTDSISPEEAARLVSRLPGVVYAEPFYPAQIQGFPVPNDPMFAPGGLIESYMQRLEIVEAWDVVKGENGDVVISISDSGVDWRHPDLHANLWTNPDEVPGNGIDDDGNGYVDDVNGWNFTNNTGDPSNFSLEYNNGSAAHGTVVTGVVAAVTNNGIGMAGTSWNAKFIPTNVVCSETNSSFCHHNEAAIYAASLGADFVNASYSGLYPSSTEHLIVQALLSLGTLVVAAASNERRNMEWFRFAPGAFQETLSVCGTKQDSDINHYNWGYTVDVCAAGRGVLGTVPDNGYERWNGTSFATPLVAGIAALVKTAFPDFSAEQVREQIRATADNIDAVNGPGYTGLLGRGRVNAYRAVTETNTHSVRMTDYSLVDDNGDGRYTEGEVITLTASLRNYLSDIDSWTYEWRSFNPHVEFVSGKTGSGGSWPGGHRRTLSTSFRWGPSMPYKAITFIEPQIRVGNRTVTGSDAARLVANDVELATHSTGFLEFDVTSEGNIGHVNLAWNRNTDFPGRLGIGFRDVNFRFSNTLSNEMGLLIGTSASQTSSSVFENRSGYLENDDFVPETSLEIFQGPEGQQESRVKLSDANASNPIGILVTQELLTNRTERDQGIALIRYLLSNPTNRIKNNLHVGLYADWSLFSHDGTTWVGYWINNIVGFDPEENITYMSGNNSIAPFMGLIALREDIPLHSRSYDWLDITRVLREPSGGWEGLSGGIVVPPPDEDNWSHMTAVGPFQLNPSSQEVIGFAILYGEDLEDLRNNARRAREMYREWSHLPAPGIPRVNPGHQLLQISWSPPSANVTSVTGYQLRHCEDATGCNTSGDWVEHAEVADTLSTISGLTNGTKYRVQVRALSSAGPSEWSSTTVDAPLNSELFDQRNSTMYVSITGEGNLGHTVVQGNSDSEGMGFLVTTSTGDHRDILFEGGLLVAHSETSIADAVREGSSGEQQEDFSLSGGTSLEITVPGERVASEVRLHLDTPMGIRVFQESYLDDAEENRDFLILRYVVESDNADKAHIGLFLDWNISPDGMDATGFNVARQLGYVMNSASNPTLVAGVRLLHANSDLSSLHYSAIDNAAILDDGFTPAEKWNLISGGVQTTEVTGRDVSQIIGAGPFDLSERPAEVMIAVVYGTSVQEFLHNADNALRLWKSRLSRSATHHTPALSASITDNGNLWYAWERDIAPTSATGLWLGQGFVAQTASGDRRQVLRPSLQSVSSLVISTSAGQVSDALPEADPSSTDHTMQEDFVRAPNTVLSVLSYLQRTYQDGRVRLTDSGASDPLGVEILQRSYVDGDSNTEDFVLLRYGILNQNSTTLDNLFVGLAIDWEASTTSGGDFSGFDAIRQTGYIMDAPAGQETLVLGTRLLIQEPLHYQTPTRQEMYSHDGEGLTTERKRGLMTDGIETGSRENADLVQWTSTGPFRLRPGDSTVVAFAVVSGTSIDDFLMNADRALYLWQNRTVSSEDERPLPGREWTLAAPYPHPAIFPMQLRFEAPEQGAVQLTIYDLLGRRIREVIDRQYNQGQHTVTWDGMDEAGKRVASGLYLIRMSARSATQNVVQSQKIVIVR